MPPKFKFKKEKIVATAFDLVRTKGWNSLSTRTLADALGASAKPIYSFFTSMDDLEEALVDKAVDLLYEYMTRKRTGDPWIDHGIGYVIFALEEKHLFRGSNNEKNIKHFKAYGERIWEKCTDSLSDYPPFRGLNQDQIYQVQLTRWLMAHGLAFQVSNPPPNVWNLENIVLVVEKGSMAILSGLKKEFGPEGG